MPSRKVKQSERRRCPQACRNCKRRKERCDGRQPCSRCICRGVHHDCSFSHPVETVPPEGSTSLASPSSVASLDSAPRGRTSQAYSDWRRLPRSTSPHDMSIDIEGPVPAAATVGVQHHRRSPQVFPAARPAPVPHLSRLIQAGKGNLVFIGDSANLCFLQTIRRLIRQSLGACAFSDDPLRHLLVEAAPSGRPSWVAGAVEQPPPPPVPTDAANLLRWFLSATHCVLNLFDEAELKDNLSRWLQEHQQKQRPQVTPPSSSDGTRVMPIVSNTERDAMDAIFFLIFAIGAQTGPEDQDELAEQYFNYGRYLTMPWTMEEPSISAIQAYVLITMFLLGASRRNAAFMHLGVAVRAAYAMGIHRAQVNAIFDHAEYITRERLWKVLRILDTFMSASMGRPPSTIETRDTKLDENYSASNDLCAIFEAILTDVYSKRMVSTDVLERISAHHRLWAARFTSGLATDGIQPEAYKEVDGVKEPNIGLCHLKEAYYWTIMLISQPFLIENVSRRISSTTGQATPHDVSSPSHAPSDQVLTYACVNSAIRTLDLLRSLLSVTRVPKRLPFVVNSVFVSALVLGLAQFGDLDRVFPLDKNVAVAHQLLALFSSHDAVAQRYLIIVTNMQAACDSYVEKRARSKMERHSMLIGGLFGIVDEGRDKSHPLYTAAPESDSQSAAAGQPSNDEPRRSEIDLTPPVTDTEESINMGLGSTVFSAPARADLNAFMDFGDDNSMQMLSDMSGLTDMIFSMSPRTLSFDSFDRNLPLFPTMDASMLRIADGVMDGGT
ncbi:Zinc c6 transcription factor [Pleurostoma richardsiae]|uniref:Zinc c6 transcription factor n=1 Tax=Pleurostoma richardsiae TaxID=41990 RepID=A0AA38S831_9PEZI|nr:Zinc c6 transcription factor [Pleurostoma richardsiae]